MSTNPCGESPLYPNEACNLGSINIASMVKDGKFDFETLKQVTAVATRFLDDVIDVNHYPLPEIAEAVKLTRKIGLGVMGWADLLFQLRIAYDSEDAYALAAEIMGTIQNTAHETSVALGKEKGIPEPLAHLGRRNATLTCIAPTGTIALLANCSSGIEPLFALEHTRVRTQIDGTKVVMKQRNRYYEQAIKEGLSEEVMKKVFVTSHDVTPTAHVRTQGVFQRYTDLAVSKTVNLRHECCVRDVLDAYILAWKEGHECCVRDVLDAYILAWKEGCKGITVYRDGSKSSQVLYRKEDEKKAESLTESANAPKEAEPVPVMAGAPAAAPRFRFVLKRPKDYKIYEKNIKARLSRERLAFMCFSEIF